MGPSRPRGGGSGELGSPAEEISASRHASSVPVKMRNC